MEVFVLITCLTVVQAFPSSSFENSNVEHDNRGSNESFTHTTLDADRKNALQDRSQENKQIVQVIDKINSLKYGRSRTFGTLASFAVGGLLAALDLVEEVVIEGDNGRGIGEDAGNFVRLRRQEDVSTTTESATSTFQIPTAISDLPDSTTEIRTEEALTTEIFGYHFTTQSFESINAEILKEIHEGNSSNRVRQIRQEDDAENEVGSNDSNSNNNGTDNNDDEEEEEDDDGGGGGLLGAIISGFLGSLSKPDGSVDVDAVVSVIGSLSALRDDGTYDFQGLQDTLNAFFGGDDEGGSDVGAFAGGALAAVIKGLANPPGAKGAGSFLGSLLKQVLPALSGPGATEEGVTTVKPQVNAGGFLWGLLKSLFGGNNENTNNRPSMFVTIKTNLVKFIFSALSSILTSSSSIGKNNW